MTLPARLLTIWILVTTPCAYAEQSKLNPNLLLRGSFDNSLHLFQNEKKGHVAFMGGSITEMNGYRPLMMKWLQKRFPKTNFTFTNAGISSTCSTTGAFRLKEHVLDKGSVDLFFVEFAVNDDQDAVHAREACHRGMEGIIRHLRVHNPNADIVVTYFVNPGMLAALQAGKAPLPMAAHEEVLRHYDVSAVHLAKEVAERINAGTFTWKEFGGTHPKLPGNSLCAELAGQMLDHAWKGEKKGAFKLVPHPLPPNLFNRHSYVSGRFLSPEHAKRGDNWKWDEPEWRKLPGGKRGRYLGKPLLHAETSGSKTTIGFDGVAIGAFVLAGPDAGILDFVVDGKITGSIDLYHRYSRGLHYPRTVIFAHDLPVGRHCLEITVSAKSNAASKGNAVRILQFCVN
jgi:lysophospholipase L1-like esterase